MQIFLQRTNLPVWRRLLLYDKVNTKYIKFEEMKEKYENEINNIKDEMNKLKETISVMQNKITELNQEIHSSKTNNIS